MLVIRLQEVPASTRVPPHLYTQVPETHSPSTILAAASVTSKDIVSQNAAAQLPQRVAAASSTLTLHQIRRAQVAPMSHPSVAAPLVTGRLGDKGRVWLRPPYLDRAEVTSGPLRGSRNLGSTGGH